MAIPRELAFEVAEYRGRLEKVRRSMSERRLDGLLLFAPGSINYLSGFDNDNLTDLTCLIVPLARDPVLVLFWFEAGRAENSSCVEEVVRYGSSTVSSAGGLDGVGAIVEAVDRLGLRRGKLGVEEGAGISIPDHRRLVDGLAEARIENPFGIVESARRRKSVAEIAYMRQAASIVDAAVEAGTRAAAVGVRDTDIAAEILATLHRRGSETVCFGPIVASGFRAGAPHSSFNGRVLQPGDTLFLEFTAQVRRYCAPIMRTAVLGEPTDEQRRAAEAGAAAVETVIRTAGPGLPATEVARAASAVLAPVLPGLMFHGNFGYPVGIGYPPSWTEHLGIFLREGDQGLLEAGMTFHLPVSLRRYGEWGINQSHTMLVTESGAEALTTAEARLQVLA